MTTTLDATNAPVGAPAGAGVAFGHRLAPAGDPLEGASFDALYDAKIKPQLSACEKERQGALKTFVLALVAGGLAVFLEYLMLRTPPGFVVFMTMAGAAAFGYLPLQAVASKAKTGVIDSLCQPLGVAYSLSGPDAAEFPTFLSLNLLPRPDSKSFQDFFSGRRGQVGFELCEATLTQGSGKNRRTVFQGELIRLSTPRRLGSTTVVLRNAGWLSRFECPHGLERVGLEDPHFNETFAVFGADQVEAREILTPTFMLQLDELEGIHSGAHLRCAFVGADLLIAFECSNQFEIGGMFTSLVDRSRVEKIARNLEAVFKLIDEFQGA